MEQHNIGSREDLTKYRIETAKVDLQSAKILFTSGEFRGANSHA